MHDQLVNEYRGLKRKIPRLKRELRAFLNQHHKLNLSENFWWVLGGEYALYAEYISAMHKKDSRILYELEKGARSGIKVKDLSSVLVNLLGRDMVSGIRQGISEESASQLNDENLGFQDENSHFAKEPKTDMQTLSIPFDKTCRALNKLEIYKNKIKQKISSRHLSQNQFKKTASNSSFTQFLVVTLPSELLENFPKWFLSVAGCIVNKNHKWKTHFGLELTIFHRILIAESYSNFGPKKIQVVSHGATSGAVGFWHLFRFSLFPNLVIGGKNSSLFLPKKKCFGDKSSVLYCPPQFPWVFEFFSLFQWRMMVRAHQATVKILEKEMHKSKNVRIRYKDFSYLNGYSGPILLDDYDIPREERRFEEAYQHYGLIVSLGFGTIAAKCYVNEINQIVYHLPLGPFDIKTHECIMELPGVYNEFDLYMSALKDRVRDPC